MHVHSKLLSCHEFNPAEAFKHIGHEAAANAASSKGTGVGLEQVRELASEETRISVTDQETQALFTQGIRSQLELQKGFQQFQWLRFDRFHKVSSAFRLAQSTLNFCLD